MSITGGSGGTRLLVGTSAPQCPTQYIAQALSVANELQHDFVTLLVQFLHTEAYKVWPETDPSHAAIDCRNEHESD